MSPCAPQCGNGLRTRLRISQPCCRDIETSDHGGARRSATLAEDQHLVPVADAWRADQPENQTAPPFPAIGSGRKQGPTPWRAIGRAKSRHDCMSCPDPPPEVVAGGQPAADHLNVTRSLPPLAAYWRLSSLLAAALASILWRDWREGCRAPRTTSAPCL